MLDHDTDAWVLQAAQGLQRAQAQQSKARELLALSAPPRYYLRSALAYRRLTDNAAATFHRAGNEVASRGRSLALNGAGADPD
jgi:hypothetical protein